VGAEGERGVGEESTACLTIALLWLLGAGEESEKTVA